MKNFDLDSPLIFLKPRFVCSKCGRKFLFRSSLIKDKDGKLICKNCRHVVTANIQKSPVLVCLHPESAKEILYSLLTDQRFRIEVVETPDECREKIRSTEFDVLIIDSCFLKLQDKVNIPLLHELAGLLPVIVIAGEEDLEIENKIRGEKIFYYLVKPINQKELIEVIREAVKWSRAKRAERGGTKDEG